MKNHFKGVTEAQLSVLDNLGIDARQASSLEASKCITFCFRGGGKVYRDKEQRIAMFRAYWRQWSGVRISHSQFGTGTVRFIGPKKGNYLNNERRRKRVKHPVPFILLVRWDDAIEHGAVQEEAVEVQEASPDPYDAQLAALRETMSARDKELLSTLEEFCQLKQRLKELSEAQQEDQQREERLLETQQNDPISRFGWKKIGA